MSNFLAIATVTAALNENLQAAIGTDVPGAAVTTIRPDALANGNRAGTGVNLYLYQVTPNSAWRNADLPTRAAGGNLVQRPQVALDLHYLLSFYGDESRLEPQRLLGSTVRTLHARPMLTRQGVRDTVANPSFAYLAESNLADEVELVKFTPISLSLEELSKLWSVFFQTPYTLSVAYQATVLLIESEDTPQPTLPVRQRRLYINPFRQPVIDRVTSAEGEDQPITAGSILVIFGRRLQADPTLVRVGGVEMAPQEVSDREISLTLANDMLRPGVQGVQVLHPTMLGEPPVPHRGMESNAAAFVLRPTITEIRLSPTQPGGVDLTVQLNPKVGMAQQIVLLLNELSGGGRSAYTFTAPRRDTDTDTITIPIRGVVAGEYLVRVQVDGAESPLETDSDPNSPTFNRYIGPKVMIGDLLRAADIGLTTRLQGGVVRATGQLTVVDQEGSAVSDATVSATWRLPDGTTRNQTEPTNRQGQAGFTVTGDRGTYTFTLTDITKADYMFDPENSELSKSITRE